MSNDPYSLFLETLRDIGLLEYLSKAEIETALEETRAEGTPTDLFYYLPKLVYRFDAEAVYPSQAGDTYLGLVEELSEISRGGFLPENIYTNPPPEMEPSLDWEDESWRFTLHFDFGGRSYSHNLMRLEDWVDASFINTINTALTEAGNAEHYYWLNTGDQTVAVAFLNEAQFLALRSAGFTELQDWESTNTDGWEQG